jgi:hypothetical protein
VVKTADNAIKITTTAIAVKPKPRLDALRIENLRLKNIVIVLAFLWILSNPKPV